MCPSPGETWVLQVNAHIATFTAGLTGQMSNHLHLSGKNTLSSSTWPFVTCVLHLMVSFMKGGWRVLLSMEFGQRTDLVLKVSPPLPRWQNLYSPLFKPQCPALLHPHHTPPCRGSAPSTCPCPKPVATIAEHQVEITWWLWDLLPELGALLFPQSLRPSSNSFQEYLSFMSPLLP